MLRDTDMSKFNSLRTDIAKVLMYAGLIPLCSACSFGLSDRYPKELIAAECKKNFVQINKKLEVSDLYVDRQYLRILLQPSHGSYSVGDMVQFLFETKLNSIETTNQDAHGNPLVFSLLQHPGQDYIRLSLKPLGHPACKTYENPARYPAQTMPWLRKLGLKEGSCVAIESSSSATVKTGIHVREQLIASQFDYSQRQSRYHVELRDSSVMTPDIAASMVEIYARAGGGKYGRNYYFPCDTGARQIQTFRQAFSSTGNPDIAPPMVVEVPPSELPPSYRRADDKWLDTLHWEASPGAGISSAVINASGTAWIGRKFTKPGEVPSFNSLFQGTIYSSPILVPQRGRDITGLAQSPKGYAVISTTSRGPRDSNYVLEFDVQGRLLAIFELSSSQYDKLTGEK